MLTQHSDTGIEVSVHFGSRIRIAHHVTLNSTAEVVSSIT